MKDTLIPTVTEVIGFVNSRAFDNINPEVLAQAAERGTEFHRLAAAKAENLWVNEVPQSCAGLLTSFNNWFDAMVEGISLIEGTLVHPGLKYMGHPDFIGLLRGDKHLTLIDWKTPRVASRSWRLQLAAYRELAKSNGYYVTRVAALQPHPEGKPAKFTEYTKSLTEDFAIFRAALTVWEFFNRGLNGY